MLKYEIELKRPRTIALPNHGAGFSAFWDAAEAAAYADAAEAMVADLRRRLATLGARYSHLSLAVGKPAHSSRAPEHFVELLKQTAEAKGEAAGTRKALKMLDEKTKHLMPNDPEAPRAWDVYDAIPEPTEPGAGGEG